MKIHVCMLVVGIPQSYTVREDESVFSVGVFHHCAFSPDGRYLICCNGVGGVGRGEEDVGEGGLYKLLVWDSYKGELIHTPLSGILHLYVLCYFSRLIVFAACFSTSTHLSISCPVDHMASYSAPDRYQHGKTHRFNN